MKPEKQEENPLITPGSDLPPGLGRCRTCRWWVKWQDHGRCARPDLDNKCRSDCVYVMGSTGHKGLRLMIGPDFGCVHHEEKE